MRRLLPEELGVLAGPRVADGAERLIDRLALVLVGLTGAGKTTTVEQLCAAVPLAAVLPDRRALTDSLILPTMTGSRTPVADRVERFRLTAAFRERHPGGMGEVLSWLLLPPGLPPGPVLFDGLRGAAETTAAAAMPKARFLVLDCPPEGRLWRLCGRNDSFDRAGVGAAALDGAAAGSVQAIRSVLSETGFAPLASADALDDLARMLADVGVEPATVARSAAIIVEESRHYDPESARESLLRLAPDRTLPIDTGSLAPTAVAAAVAAWLEAG